METTLYDVIELINNEPFLYLYMKQCPLEILQCMSIKTYKEDYLLLKQGEKYDSIFFLAEGTLEAFVDSKHGKKHRQAIYEKGSFFGEMELFQQMPYLSSMRTLTSVRLLVLQRDAFIKWVKLDHLFASHMVRAVCVDAYNMCISMEANILYTVKQRICQYFLSYVSDANDKKAVESITVTSGFLSERMAVTQRSVNRVLKELKEKQIISVSSGRITLLDAEALKQEINNG